MFLSTSCWLIGVKVKKFKGIPLQVWTGSEGFRRMRLSDFETVGTRKW
jgi:hypothetical protein